MWNWLIELDRVLRGEKTRLESLRAGSIDVPVVGISAVVVVLGFIYGACMGTFALLRPEGPVYEQLLATTLKVPALFFLTLIITFPSLYVFNALVGSRLSLGSLLKLLVAALGVTLAMLAALGPIVAFFSVCTESNLAGYSFMVLLNVLVFSLSGLLGLKFLLQTLHRLTVIGDGTWVSQTVPTPPADAASNVEGDKASAPLEIAEFVPRGPLDELEGHVLGAHEKTVFRCWVVVYGLVGAQMGWVLRPFIGDPNREFQWFRERDSHFFEAVWTTLQNLF